MFIQKCFIRKNTTEITNKIANIGYKLLFTANRNEGKYLVCANKFCFGQNDELSSDYIDCGENEDLFLAIAALRDDTDKDQLFFHNDDTNCEYPTECIHDEFHMFAMVIDTWEYIDNKDLYHKGTPNELQKHFLNK